MKPIVSIIVPVYNVPDYLSRCFDGILGQTFPHWEALLIDDGSTVEACAEICDEYAARDPRFHAIHKKNGGVCSARNTGLRTAAGQYIIFCDQDDYFSPYLLESVLTLQQEHPNTMVIWDVTPDRSQLPDAPFAQAGGRCTFYEKNQCDAVYMRMVFAPIWNKLLRRDILCADGYPPAAEPILFDEDNRVGTEDLPFSLAYAVRFFERHPTGQFCLLEDYFPHYYEAHNTGSVTKSDRHLAHYCEQTMQRDGPLTHSLEAFFGCTPEGMAPVYQFYLHCLCFGLSLLSQFHDAARSKNILRQPEFQRVLTWLRQHRVYSPYYLPLRCHWVALTRWLFRLEQMGSAWYWRFYWLGYALLGGHWRR